MDELFNHLLDETGGTIENHRITNRIVFPNHDICMNVKNAIDQRGGFLFATIIPDFEDFNHMDPSERISAMLEVFGSYGDEIENVVWGFNSVQYEYNGIPSLGVPVEISKMLGIPVYYEYVDEDDVAAGSLIADAKGSSVSFANIIDKSSWAYYPQGDPNANDILFRCGMGAMTMPDGSQLYFEDTDDPTMRMLAQRGNVSVYFYYLKDQFGTQLASRQKTRFGHACRSNQLAQADIGKRSYHPIIKNHRQPRPDPGAARLNS